MKSAVSVVIILGLIIGVSIYGNQQTNVIASDLINANNKLYESVVNNDYNEARKNVKLLSEDINRHSDFLSAFIDRNLIDNIEFTIGQIEGLVEAEDKNELQGHILKLNKQIQHLEKSLDLNLENLL